MGLLPGFRPTRAPPSLGPLHPRRTIRTRQAILHASTRLDADVQASFISQTLHIVSLACGPVTVEPSSSRWGDELNQPSVNPVRDLASKPCGPPSSTLRSMPATDGWPPLCSSSISNGARPWRSNLRSTARGGPNRILVTQPASLSPSLKSHTARH